MEQDKYEIYLSRDKYPEIDLYKSASEMTGDKVDFSINDVGRAK